MKFARRHQRTQGFHKAAMEEIKVSGSKLKSKLKELIKEGNVRRVVLRNPGGKDTFGHATQRRFCPARRFCHSGAAVGAVLFLAKDYTIGVEREAGKSVTHTPPTPPTV